MIYNNKLVKITYNFQYVENFNINRIMIENAIKRYRESISENKDKIDDTG